MQVIIALLIICSLSACIPNDTASQLADINQELKTKNFKQAEIKLKNFLIENPTSSSARFMLGETYFKTGLLDSAEKEYRLALEFNPDNETTTSRLLQALYLQNKYEDILLLIAKPLSNMPEATYYKSLALMSAGLDTELMASIESLERLNDDHFSELAKTLRYVAASDYQKALDIIERLPYSEATSLSVIRLKGFIQSELKYTESAVDTFREYLNRLPQNSFAKLFLIEALLNNSEYQEAKGYAENLAETFPRSYIANKLLGTAQFELANFHDASLSMEKALLARPNDPFSNAILGTSLYKLEQFEQALPKLLSAAAAFPQTHPIQQVLLDCQIRLGNYVEAYNDVKNIDTLSIFPTSLLVSLGLGLSQENKNIEARNLLGVFDGLSVEGEANLLTLGLLKLKLEDKSGLTLLESAASDGGSDVSRRTLLEAYLYNGQLEKAKSEAIRWLSEDEESVDAITMRARTALAEEDVKTAFIFYEKLYEIDSLNSEAIDFLSLSKIEKGETNKAFQMYSEFIRNTPTPSLEALRKYLLLARTVNKVDLVSDALTERLALQSDDNNSAIILAELLLSNKKPNEALRVLSNIKETSNLPDGYWQLKAEANLVQNNYSESREIYKKWRTYDPKNAKPWVFPPWLSIRIGDYSRAARESQQALQVFPDSTEIKLISIYSEVMLRNFNRARNEFVRLNESARKYPIYFKIRGLLSYSSKDLTNAEKDLTRYYNITNEEETALHISNIKLKQNKPQEAFDLLESHVENDTRNINATLALITHYESLNVQTEKIKTLYTTLLEKEPDNVIFLNNFAWYLQKNNQLPEAERVARKAYYLAKENITVIDTLAVILFNQGKKQEARELLEKALLIEPKSKKLNARLGSFNA